VKSLLRISVLMLCALSAAHAQLALPQLPAPLPQPGAVLREVAPAVEPIRPALSSVRTRARELLRRYPRDVERDPRGAPVVRAVILALSPDAAALQQALTRGFRILSDDTPQPLGERVVTLLVPQGLDTQRALQELRAADSAGSYDFDHLFVESATPVAPRPVATSSAGPLPPVVDVRVGLIDGGVDAEHPAFATRRPQLSGCGGKSVPGAHGTAVASLFVGRAAQFHGAAPGAELHAVDVYCGGDLPGGRVRDIVLGLSELMAAQVRIINISIVGPDNAVLAAVVRKVLAQSILIVAAAGNDGPNAKPLYPAAYPGVVAVTGVDAREKVLLEAGSGAHVSFAAPGADMVAAVPGGRYANVRGTSYAAPLVAGLLARLQAGGEAVAVDRLVQQLAASAADRGKKGRDARYGYGLVGMDLRTDPTRFAGSLATQ
jgi:subtilisin family serine protease